MSIEGFLWVLVVVVADNNSMNRQKPCKLTDFMKVLF